MKIKMDLTNEDVRSREKLTDTFRANMGPHGAVLADNTGNTHAVPP